MKKFIKILLVTLMMIGTLIIELGKVEAMVNTGKLTFTTPSGWKVTSPRTGDVIKGYMLFYDNEAVYCIEPNKEATFIYDYNKVSSDEFGISEQLKLTLSYVSYYGYGYKNEALGIDHSDIIWYAATQNLIWEMLSPGSNAILVDGNNLINYQQEISRLVEDVQTLPNLVKVDGKGEFNNGEVVINAGQSIVLQDMNNVLDYYSIETNEDVIVTKLNNQVTITADYNVKEKTTITLQRFKDTGVSLFFVSPNRQTVAKFYVENALEYNIKLNVNKKGSLELIKVNFDNQLIDGAIVNVRSIDGSYNKDHSIIDGRIVIDGLDFGEYIIEETVAPSYYVKSNEVYRVKINPGETTTKVIINRLVPKGELIIKKIDAVSKEKLCGVTYQLKADENILDADGTIVYYRGEIINNDKSEYFVTDENGEIYIKNLLMGKYILKEIKSLDGYIIDEEDYFVEFKQSDNVTKIYRKEVQMENDYTKVDFYKKDSLTNNNLVGAKFKLIEKESGKVIDSWISDGDKHTINKLVVGKSYILEEIEAPNGYVIKESTEFTVENTGESQEIIVYNEKQVITGDKTSYIIYLGGILFSGIAFVCLLKQIN